MGTQAVEHNEPPTTDSAANEHVPEQGLRYCVRAALERYFEDLNGHNPGCLYNLVIREVEQPLLETVLANTQGNQTRAAQLLGINRTTLRKKLRYYELD